MDSRYRMPNKVYKVGIITTALLAAPLAFAQDNRQIELGRPMPTFFFEARSAPAAVGAAIQVEGRVMMPANARPIRIMATSSAAVPIRGEARTAPEGTGGFMTPGPGDAHDVIFTTAPGERGNVRFVAPDEVRSGTFTFGPEASGEFPDKVRVLPLGTTTGEFRGAVRVMHVGSTTGNVIFTTAPEGTGGQFQRPNVMYRIAPVGTGGLFQTPNQAGATSSIEIHASSTLARPIPPGFFKKIFNFFSGDKGQAGSTTQDFTVSTHEGEQGEVRVVQFNGQGQDGQQGQFEAGTQVDLNGSTTPPAPPAVLHFLQNFWERFFNK